ncbi:activating signal cointegrator 1 complex subunit 2 homolog isoform X1 [Mangifera indica]|uniref:activating signal cointegrator 1 complex subunit 2 homolog isoform X1 n=1 Tax=Mangifera indica TaxID=29780 RepID=UPI001CF992F0|nr:activating signal cointegrator 1 complex subunit 2 homolog isoform X1 [Mangifera indica]
MVDLQTVCCMCGDVGFPDKLFRCNKCRNRIQHSFPSAHPSPPCPSPTTTTTTTTTTVIKPKYCSNYYSEYAEPIEVCDWCQSEQRSSSRHGSSSKKSSTTVYETGISNRSEYSGEKLKQQDREESADKGKNPSGTPSPRPTTRRYKLLKDVMC